MYRLWYSLFSFNLFTEYDYIYMEKRSPQVDHCIATVYVTQAHPSQLLNDPFGDQFKENQIYFLQGFSESSHK